MNLTDEQKAIVEHVNGPALVFAVAGAGKTTAMVHRIKRLISVHSIKPERILATTYSKEGVKDLIDECQKLGIPKELQIKTLHAHARSIISSAKTMKLISDTWKEAVDEDKGIQFSLINDALEKIAKEENIYRSDLDIDREEVDEKISYWKANLFYSDLDDLNFPPNILAEIQLAEDPNPQLIKAYKYYEQMRRKGNWYTFDDMLVMGWELLMKSERLLTDQQNKFDYILVDEFQDVNLVQYKILDLITKRKNNYMVIGDDDQCIYEWRGASTKFILYFEKTYNAKPYLMTDNFRCKASTICAANNLIHHNKNRYHKRLQLTQGFNGKTYLFYPDGLKHEAEEIYQEIMKLIDGGSQTKDIVILIRTYAQTPSLENIFIRNNYPHYVVVSDPFYKRQEAINIFNYLRWFLIEIEIKNGNYPQSRSKENEYITYFKEIIDKPRRYIARSIVDNICEHSINKKVSVLDGLTLKSSEMKPRTIENVKKFFELFDQLVIIKNDSATKILKTIFDQTDYKKYIIDKSHYPVEGELKAQILDALIDFSFGKGSVKEFLDYIIKITFNMLEQKPDPSWLKIMTIFKAKGQEWDHVIIPGCNDGTMPLIKNNPVFGINADNKNRLEEERRLFYVALTRAKQNVFLFSDKTKGGAQFLNEADITNVNTDLEFITRLLNKDPEKINEDDILSFLKSVKKHQLERYVEFWLKGADDFKRAVYSILTGLRIKTSIEKNNTKKNDIAKHQAKLNKHDDYVKQNINDTHPEKIIQVILDKNNHTKISFDHQKIIFVQMKNKNIVAKINDKIIGKVYLNPSENKSIEMYQFSVGRQGVCSSVSKSKKSIYVKLVEKKEEKSKNQIEKPIPSSMFTEDDKKFKDASLLEDIDHFMSFFYSPV